MINKILITGASGNLGGHVIEQIDGQQLIVLDRNKKSTINRNLKLDRVTADLLDYEQVNNSLKQYREIPIIIHIAGITDTNRNHPNFNDNLKMTENIIKIAKSKTTAHIIFISSNSVNYSQRPYAVSKKLSEDLVVTSGIPYTIIRPTLLLDNSSPEIKKTMILFRKLPLIPVISHGNHLIQPIFTNDLVSFIKLCINNKISLNKIYTVGGESGITYKSFLGLIAIMTKSAKSNINIPPVLFDLLILMLKIFKQSSLVDQLTIMSQDLIVDNSKAMRELSWKPSTFDEVSQYFTRESFRI